MASTSSSQFPALPAIPPWIISRLGNLDLNHGSMAKYLTHLAHEGTARAKTILSEADAIANILGLDDEVLDGLVVGLGMG